MNFPLPEGFCVVIDPSTRRLNAQLLVGGSPPRLLRLSATGAKTWPELTRGPLVSVNARTLARQLTDASVAHPRPPARPGRPDVTVVIPVRDRPQMLRRCLESLKPGYPIVVVDDGSRDPAAIAAVAADFGARLLRRHACGGPAAARNTGLAEVHTELVAFLDSDCLCVDDWIERVADHFADPLVAIVAPRIVASPSSRPAGRFACSAGALDLGSRECRVMPGAAVPYVPTAALLARREAVAGVGGFDERLRYGEDVDLVWRLHRAGGRVRYQPEVSVQHDEPERWPDLWMRRFHYGSSAAPLGIRHPDAIAPLVLHPWPSAILAGLLLRRPSLAALIALVSALPAVRNWRRAGLPLPVAAKVAADGILQTYCAVGRYCTQFGGPLLVVALALGAGRRAPGGRRWALRLAGLLLASPLRAASARPVQPGPARFLIAHLMDDMMYGAGVWAGCLRHRTLIPLRPRIVAPKWLAARGGDETVKRKGRQK